MAVFIAEEYKKRLESSVDCKTCEKVPLPKLGKNDRYIFISYSHKDYRKVYCDLADLYESGIPFWYDMKLTAGREWDIEVREKMEDPRCAGVIFYMSEELFLSEPIQKEIRIVCGECDDSMHPGVKLDYFSVNLTDMPPSKILQAIFPRKQFSDVDDAMAEQVKWSTTLGKAFPDKATFLPFHNPYHRENLVEQIGVVFGITPNYNPYDFSNALFLSGTAIIQFGNGTRYEGTFSNGLFTGCGTLRRPDGSSYTGEWLEGRRHGSGKLVNPNGYTYAGNWLNGLPCGHGTADFPNGTTYDGEWKDGKPHGFGAISEPSGIVYTGEWLEGHPTDHSISDHNDGIVDKIEKNVLPYLLSSEVLIA